MVSGVKPSVTSGCTPSVTHCALVQACGTSPCLAEVLWASTARSVGSKCRCPRSAGWLGGAHRNSVLLDSHVLGDFLCSDLGHEHPSHTQIVFFSWTALHWPSSGLLEHFWSNLRDVGDRPITFMGILHRSDTNLTVCNLFYASVMLE